MNVFVLIAAVVTLALLAAPLDGLASACLDYAAYLRPVGSVYSSVTPYDFEYRDGLVYACTWEGFAVYDVRDPARMSLLSHLSNLGWTQSVELVGNTAYVMTRDAGLRLIDVSDPRALRLGATMAERCDLGASVLEDGIIYYHPSSQIFAFDPAQMRFVGHRYHFGANLNTIGAMAGRLLVGGNNVLTIHDATDVSQMQELSRYQAPDSIWDIFTQGDEAFLACGNGGIVALQVAPDGTVREVGRINVGSEVLRVAASNSWVYALSSYGMTTIDFRDPLQPVVCGVVPTEAVSSRFHIEGNTAYVARVSGILAIDVTNPHEAPLLSGLPIDDASDVVSHDGYAYYAAWSRRGWMASIADPEHPAAPVPITAFPAAVRWVSSLEARGNLLYAATGYDHCLSVLDISDAAHPRLLGTVPGSGLTYDLEVAGSYAFVACNTAGLRIIDVSDPQAPRLVTTLLAGEAVWRLELAGDHLFVLAGGGTTWLVDVSDPTAPGVPLVMPALRYAQHVHVRGSMAYVVFGGRVDLYDLADVDSPVLVSQIPAHNSSGWWGIPDIAVDHNTCYISLGWALQVVDITDRRQPEFIQFLHTPGYGRWPVVVGDYLHILSMDAGVHVAARQCEEPLAVPVDFRPGSDRNSFNCAAANGVLPLAILGTGEFPVARIDHRTVRCGPAGATEAHANRYGPLRHEEDVNGDGLGDLVFHFRTGETGLQCADTKIAVSGETYDGLSFQGSDTIRPVSEADKATVTSITLAPNPFNPLMAVAFTLGRPAHVRIAVYDLRGRLVAPVADAAYAEGNHAVEWAGRDAAGKDAPSGEYFVRIAINGAVETRKATLLR